MSEETPAQLREAYETAVADAKAARAELEATKAALRVHDAKDAADKANYPREYGTLYAQAVAEGEINPTAIESWATQFNLPKVEASPPTAPVDTSTPTPTTPAVDDSALLSSMGAAGTRPGEGGGMMPTTDPEGEGVSTEEWRRTYNLEGREAAEALLRRKGVVLNRDNPYVTGRG